MHEHYTPHTLAWHLAEASEPAHQVEATLNRCPECARARETLGRWSRQLDHPDPLVACEIESSWRRLLRLLERPDQEWDPLIRLDPELQGWGLAWRLLAESKAVLPIDPSLARQFAQLAMTVWEVLDRDFYGHEHCDRLRTRIDTALEEARRQHERRGVGRTAIGGLLRRLYASLDAQRA